MSPRASYCWYLCWVLRSRTTAGKRNSSNADSISYCVSIGLASPQGIGIETPMMNSKGARIYSMLDAIWFKLLLVQWEPVAGVCHTELVATNGSKQHLPIPMEKEGANIDMNLKGSNGDPVKSAPISILLLYRRDDLQVSRRVVELRNRLQSECGTKVKVM